MMDERLLRQFRMAQGPHNNRPRTHEDQEVSSGNGTKETAPAELEEKEIVTDGLAALAKRYQPKQGAFPRSRSR